MTFTILDGALLLIIALGGVMGMYTGFLRSFFGLAGWIGSVYGALELFPIVQNFLGTRIQSEAVVFLSASLGTFFALMFVSALIRLVIIDLLEKFIPKDIDRGLGMLFGVAKTAGIAFIFTYLISIILSHFKQLSIDNPGNWPNSMAKSRTITIFCKYYDTVTQMLPLQTRKSIDELKNHEKKEKESGFYTSLDDLLRHKVKEGEDEEIATEANANDNDNNNNA